MLVYKDMIKDKASITGSVLSEDNLTALLGADSRTEERAAVQRVAGTHAVAFNCRIDYRIEPEVGRVGRRTKIVMSGYLVPFDAAINFSTAYSSDGTATIHAPGAPIVEFTITRDGIEATPGFGIGSSLTLPDLGEVARQSGATVCGLGAGALAEVNK